MGNEVVPVTVQTRIALCRLIEKMDRQKAYCEQLGLVNRSAWNPAEKPDIPAANPSGLSQYSGKTI